MLNTDPFCLPAGEASFCLLLINSMWYTWWRSQLLFVSDKLIILSKDYNHISIDRSMYSGSGGNSSSGGDNQLTALSSVQYQQCWLQHNHTAFNFQHLGKGNIYNIYQNVFIDCSFRSINPLLFYAMLNTDPVWLPAGEASFCLLLINSIYLVAKPPFIR